MPIVVRDGMQYQLEGPNDVPSSGNLIGPIDTSPGNRIGGPDYQLQQNQNPFGFQGGGGGKVITPWVNKVTGETWNAPSLGYTNPDPNWGQVPVQLGTLDQFQTGGGQPFNTSAPTHQLEGPNDVPSSGNLIGPAFGPTHGGSAALGGWANPSPEFTSAPGYESYAPTAAYQYSPAGGTDAYGGYPAYGGGGDGGGGGFLSGGGGGSDTSTLGGALSALSLLGGANSLSGFLTGKSLLEHAGVPNPFSNSLGGGEGLSFTDYLPNAIKDALNIYPSQAGLLTPGGGTALLTPLQGEAMVNALGGTGTGTSTLSSQFTEAMNAANLGGTTAAASGIASGTGMLGGMAGGIEGASGLGGSIGLGGPGAGMMASVMPILGPAVAAAVLGYGMSRIGRDKSMSPADLRKEFAPITSILERGEDYARERFLAPNANPEQALARFKNLQNPQDKYGVIQEIRGGMSPGAISLANKFIEDEAFNQAVYEQRARLKSGQSSAANIPLVTSDLRNFTPPKPDFTPHQLLLEEFGVPISRPAPRPASVFDPHEGYGE